MALDDPGIAPETPETPDDATIDYGDFRLNDEDQKRLGRFLTDEITSSLAETRKFRENIVLWREFIDPPDRQKNFPWPGASSVFVPIPRTILDALKASLKQAITKQRQLWVAEINAEDAGLEPQQAFDAARAAEKFAEIASIDPSMLNFKAVLDSWIEEILVTGIGVVKLALEPNIRMVQTFGDDEPRQVVLSRGPALFVVPTDTWMWPAGLWRSVQDMPWNGHWVRLTAAALVQRAGPPWNYVNTAEVIAAAPTATPTLGEVGKEMALGQEPIDRGFQTYEIYLLWDIFDNGTLHDIFVTFNLDTGRIHRIIYNRPGDALKPYEAEVGSPRAATIFGRGMVEPLVQPTRAINTAVNQTFDSQTLANAPSILFPENSEAANILRDGYFPGVGLPYKENKDELGVLKFPDPSAISFTMIQFFMSIMEKLSRVGPGRLGDVSAGKRVPASLGLASQQIGAETIDELIDRLRETAGRTMSRSFMLYLEDDPEIFVDRLGDEAGGLLRQVLEHSRETRRAVTELIRIRLTASSATRSIELERQNALATAQFLFGWFRQSIELVSLFLQPTTPEAGRAILLDVIKAAQEQMRRVIELSGQVDPETLVPDLAKRLEDTLASSAPPGGSAPPPAGSPTGALPGGGGGVEAIAAALGGGGVPGQ